MDTYKQLISKLREVGSVWRKVLFLEGISFLIAVIIPFLIIVFFLDNVVHLPSWGRSVILIVTLSLSISIFLKTVIFSFIRRFSDERIALHVEKKYPELQNKLINAVQFGKEASESPVASAIIEDSLLKSKTFDFGKSISRDHLKKSVMVSSLAIILLVLYGLSFREHFNNALARFLSPRADIPPVTLTKLSVSPRDTVVLSGEDVEIKAFVEGKIPGNAQIAYKMEDADWKLRVLDRSGKSTFSCIFREVTKNISFYVIAGDAKTFTYSIRVRERPNITRFRVTLNFPEYTGLPPVVEDDSNGNVRALRGTDVRIEASVDKKVEEAEISCSNGAVLPVEIIHGNIVKTRFRVSEDLTYRIRVTDFCGFTNKDPVAHSIEAIDDNAPVVLIKIPGRNMSVESSSTVPLEISAADDYGIRNVSVFLKQEGGEEFLLTGWKKNRGVKEAVFRTAVSLKDLVAEPGQVISYYAASEDWNIQGPGMGKSRLYTITVLVPEKARDLGKSMVRSVKEKLLRIISLQEANLKNTGKILRAESAVGVSAGEVTRCQVTIRKLTVELAEGLGGELFALKETLYKIISSEMLRVIKELKEKRLDRAILTQRVILEELKTLADNVKQAETRLSMQDVVSSLEEIIKKEKEIRTFTRALSLRAAGDFPVLETAKTADVQRNIAVSLTGFQSELRGMGEEFSGIAEKITGWKIPVNMKKIASYLECMIMKESLFLEDVVIGNLELIQSAIKDIIFGKASDWMKNFKSAIEKMEERLKKLTEIQEAITELTRELDQAKDFSEKEKAKAGEMAEMQQNMGTVIEKISEDLKLFPETPVSNELLTKMREIYEDVEKSAEAKSKEAIEIAVAIDEAILEALKSTTERVEDFEMWLPDEPDNIKWNLESFDVSDIPEIPLVDLPEELEDMVGELIESQEDVNELTENSTANWMCADMPMGWGVDEGGISSFSAKGKSGNRLPDSDEITGRSGAGRPGKTSGEIVESYAKDLEGSPTPPRRTMDPYQKGHVEEENPLSRSGATGGGKQSGYGEEGFSGTAPARDERALEEMVMKQLRIRSNAEGLKAALSLIYLPAGDLDRALLLIDQAEKEIENRDFRNLQKTQKKILHSLKNTYHSMTGNVYIQVDPQMSMPVELKREILAAGSEDCPKEYEKLVSEYFKAISRASFE